MMGTTAAAADDDDDDDDDETSTSLKIELYRNTIKEKPKNAKVMYQLASLLIERSQRNQRKQRERERKGEGDNNDEKNYDDEGYDDEDEDEDECVCTNENENDNGVVGVVDRLRQEAITISQNAIQVQPSKPFGYAALSIASIDHQERISSAKTAVDLLTSSDKNNLQQQYKIARLNLLFRLLVEPRQYESKQQIQGNIGKGSNLHPTKRSLNNEEHAIYNDIQSTLDEICCFKKNDLDESQKQVICNIEYKLGLFFRKKVPSNVYQPYAIQHFRNAQKLCCCQLTEVNNYKNKNNIAEMSNFWIATMNNNNMSSSSTEKEEDKIIEKCPQSYIVGLYSTFAQRFDELLVEKLNYQTPTKLRILFDEYSTCNSKQQTAKIKIKRCLDLGCGTGLSGIAFVDLISEGQGSQMDGIDLSPEMIEKALQRKCYTNLYVGDVESLLETKYESNTLDMILACDVFCYIGNLSKIFNLVSKKLCMDGYFCFSTELLLPVVDDDGDDNDNNYRLHDCARFVHKQTYIEELAQLNNFDILKFTIQPIRKNQGIDVQGILALLQKTKKKNDKSN